MSIGWQPTMETGAPTLDAQRRALVERADALVAVLERGGDRAHVEHALRDLGDYSVRHFSQEEDCHLRAQCPVIEWNGNARADLIKIVSGFRLAFEKGGAASGLAEDLGRDLSGWVARYIPGPVDGLPCCATPAR
jgi:hemerythrin-like metal-binding protein